MNEHERLAVLELKLEHLEIGLNKMETKVDEMHAMLLQARGFKWALIAFASVVGFFSGLIAPLLLKH